MRTIVISDIHGHYTQLQDLLKKVEFNRNDKLILMGDYVDRGKESKQVISFVRELDKKDNVIVLKGNHDDMFANIILNGVPDPDLFVWTYRNGGYSTLLSYAEDEDSDIFDLIKSINKFYKDDILFLDNLPLYYEDDNHIYVHAGINPVLADWKNSTEKDFLWIRKRFIFNPLLDTDKVVIFGHTPCHRIGGHNVSEPFFDYHNNDLVKIAIDGGMGFNRQLNALIIEDGKYSYKNV